MESRQFSNAAIFFVIFFFLLLTALFKVVKFGYQTPEWNLGKVFVLKEFIVVGE